MNAEEIFHQALARPQAERSAFLAAACASDEPLQRRVQALLHAHDNPGSFLAEQPPALALTVDDPISERPGTVIGPYKLMEQIGEGGMGLVFVAEQQQPVRRKVALKVIKPGMDTRQVVARFEAERQALALMDHPNIAKVLDGGTTDSRRPYFVMELFKGVPITEYCDQNQVPIRQRLELFASVCQAVQHAHQKGIIHRDIKPSNVLITLHDGTPVVKVIDFGVAKAIGQRLTDKTIYTHFSQMVGTPLYMSPEQAWQSGLDVDTRSDIYSLGVLLYELLTGTTPFDRERMHDIGYDVLRRIIREEEPPRPSTRISTLGQAATTISTQRQSEPKQLSRLIRGELDWIVMKALEKDRNRRYETANDLAMDVQRYLHDEPVLVCPPSAWYRFQKFARRNRSRLVAAAVLGVALLAVVGATAGSIGWAARDREARQARHTGQVEMILEEVERLEQEQKWPEALAAVERAEAVAGGEVGDALQRRLADARRDLAFIAKLDHIREERAASVEGKFNDAGAVRHYAEAFRAYGVDVEALPTEEMVARLQGKPALAVAVATALDDWVDARQKLGEGEPSWKPLVMAARGLDHDPLRDRLRAGWGQPYTPALQAELRRLAESIDVKAQRPGTLQLLARTLDRLHLAVAALRIRQDGQSAYPADFWLNFDLGNKLYERKDYLGTVRYCSAAVSLRPDSAAAHYNLGLALAMQGKPGEGIACYQKAIEVDPKYAPPCVTLGLALRHQGKRDEAIACYQKAIEVDPKYASAYANLGNVLRDQGKVEEAAACYQKAIEVDAKYAPANVYDSLGLTRLEQGKWHEAIACFQKAITLNPKSYDAHYDLAHAYARLGRWEQAVGLMDKLVELKPDDPWFLYCVAPLHLQVGDRAGYRRICWAMLERFEDTKDSGLAASIAKTCLLTPEAVADLDGVLKLADRAVTGTEKHLSYRYYLVCKGLAEYRAGRHAEAVQWLERVAPRASGGELDASAFAVLALAQHQRSRGAEALRALDRAEVIVAANLPDPAAGRPFNDLWHDWLRCQVLLREAEELLKPDEARIHFYRSCRRGSQDKWPEAAAEHAPSAEAATLLGNALRHQGNLTGAIATYRKAIELDPKYAPAQHDLGRVYAHLGQWDKAAAVVAQSLKLEPGNHDLWFQSAALRLHMGDRIGYRRACREMLARFGKTDTVYVLERTAKTCLLTPDAVTDFESVMKLADFAVKEIGSNPWIRWIQLTKALAEYRAGHVAAAIEWLQRVSPKASGDSLDATAFAVLAMARQRQGQAEEARAALERARAILAHKLPKLDKGQQFGDDWHDWLRCQILFREAEELLKIKRSP